jgi:hypothetical protein
LLAVFLLASLVLAKLYALPPLLLPILLLPMLLVQSRSRRPRRLCLSGRGFDGTHGRLQTHG